MSIRIGIYGYGNLGRGVESAIRHAPDMELAAVFTRRDPASVAIRTPGVPVLRSVEAIDWADTIDVMILCGGSATDLPAQSPALAAHFNCVDSFDTHAHVPEHFAAVDAAAKGSGHTALISVGWDPGLFSLARLYSGAVLPDGNSYTFWGRGVSQGHSDALRRVEGVVDARQYTVPRQDALARVRAGETPQLSPRQMHTRECYVVAAPDADKARIEAEIKAMPDYFADYDTTVHFISEETLLREHGGIPHGGFMLRSGVTGLDGEHRHLIEYRLTLESNPEFTSSVLIAYARAAVRLHREGRTGCCTVFDVPPKYLSSLSEEDLRAHLL